jgi:diguanylate cyclase (GGDEF)-like protein/PAS domain S-box-containing protein
MVTCPPPPERERLIRALFDEYIEMYAARDPRLTARFSSCFSGYTGGGAFLVKERAQWQDITRQDFAQVSGRIRIELLDFEMQDLCAEVVLTTAFFHIHLPIDDHVLSKEVARLVLVFRLEGDSWNIVHSGISIPYHLVEEGEVYPMKRLRERNSQLEALIEERTEALHRSEALYRLLTEDTLDVLWKADRDLRVTYISPADERLRGFKPEAVIGHSVFDMFTPEGRATVRDVIAKAAEAGAGTTRAGFVTFEVQHRCADGRVLWGEVLTRPELDGSGKIVGYHGITREITERKRLQDQVRHLAFIDSLTGLPNRRLLEDRLPQALSASRRSGSHGAVLFIDLDNFKPLNDVHGHAAGDQLLIEVANRLRTCVREHDTVARVGGDEFVVVLDELGTDRTTAIQHARQSAEKIRARLAESYKLEVAQKPAAPCPIRHRCTASIGVALFAGTEVHPDAVLKAADAAMYKAKARKRDSVQFDEASA